MKEFYLDSCGGGRLHCAIWTPEGEPKAVVQLIHGIAEHIGRYDDFARFLNAHGYVVAADDHMGHGGSVENGTYFVGNARADNTVTYKTPTFAGFTAYAQYSFDMNTKQDTPLGQTEGKASANRYYALGANYKVGSLDVTAVVDSYNWSSKIDTYGGTSRNLDDALTVTLGGSYDFGVAKAYLSGQYFDNMLANDATVAADQKDTMDTYASFGSYFSGKAFKGYSILAGMDAPVLGGKALFAVGYTDAKDADGSDALGKTELSRYSASVGYTYDLSRRTNVYAVAAYYKDSVDKDASLSHQDHDPSTATIYAGIRHTF